MKLVCFLLVVVNLGVSLAQYSFIPKQFVDSDWYLMKSSWFDTDFLTARSICASYNLALADIRSSADYDYLASLFCPANSHRIYQFWIGLEWDGAPVTYKWSDNTLFDPSTQLPSTQSAIEEFFCPNITSCSPNCDRATVVQIDCYRMTSTMFCSYQNELQKYFLCNNPTSTSVSYSLYTTPVDGTLVTDAYTTLTPAPIAPVEKTYSDSTWDIIRYPDCDLSFSEAQQVCNTYGGGSYLAAIDNETEYDTFLDLFRPTDERIRRMDIWLNAQYDYSQENFVWLTNGQNVTQFPRLLQDWIVVANGSWNYTYNWTLTNGINYDMCGNYNGPRGLKLLMRFDANYSILYCVPVETTDVCYALCKNYTSADLVNVTIIDQLTTTTPSIQLSTNVGGSTLIKSVYSQNCNLTIFDARAMCADSTNKVGVLATLTTTNDFLAVLDTYRPNPNTFAIYQFWIDAQWDYDFKFFRWVTTGDQVYLPYGVQIYSDSCGTNYGDYRGVVLKIEFPHNRYYLNCLPYNVTQCYGLCKNVASTPTTNTYAYQLIGQWQEWNAWTDCYMIKYFLYRNRTYMKRSAVDCNYVWLQNETNEVIDDRAQTTLTELENIQKNTERELAALSEKYKILDSVGDSFSIIAMLFVGGVYVWTVVLDILKIVMKKKEDEKKPAKKPKKKNKKNNKKNNKRKESKVDDDDNDDDKDDDEEKKNQPRTSRSRGNSIITNGKRYSIELLENVARRVSFDTKMFNSLLKPLAQSQKELLSKVRAPSNLGNSAQAEPNFTHMSREVSQVSQVGPLVSRQKSSMTQKPPESRRKSIEMNVMSRLRKLSNVMAAYRHPHEDFAKEKEYTQTLSDYFGTDYDPKMKKKREDDEENENVDKSTKLASTNPNVRQRSGGIAANKSLNEKVEEEEEKKEEEEEDEEDGFHYDTSNSILNSWYGKQPPQRPKSESGSRTEIISVASSKPEIGEEEEEEVETAANKAAKVKVENELDPKQSKSLNKKAANNNKKSKIRLEANANGGDFRRYIKRVSYANTKLSKPNTMVIIDDKS